MESKKIVISCYRDEKMKYLDSLNPPEPELIYTRALNTNMPLSEIENSLDGGDYFYMQIDEGDAITFMDYYYLKGQEKEVIEKIRSIPEVPSDGEYEDTNSKSLIYVFASNDTVPKLKEKIFMSSRSRTEMGAGGWSEAITYVSNNPWLMIFIGYSITKILDYILSKIKFNRYYSSVQKEVIYLKIKNVYKNVSRLLNVDMQFLQITNLSPIGKGKAKITIRTFSNEIYQIQCNKNGEIYTCTNIKKK